MKRYLSAFALMLFIIHFFVPSLFGETAIPEANSGFQMPIQNDHYGYRYKDWTMLDCWHPGVDLNGPGDDDDDPVYAVANGRVVFATTSNWGGVVIQHSYQGQTWYSQYGHIDKIYVSVGQDVLKGQRIAEIGSLGGISTGPHLHFEIRESDHPDPARGSFWDTTSFQDQDTVENWYEDPEIFINTHGPYTNFDPTIAMVYVKNQGIIGDVNDPAPDSIDNKATFITMLIRTIEDVFGPQACSEVLPYPDVDPGVWYYDPVCKAYSLGLLTYDDTHLYFNPGDVMFRSWATAVIKKAMIHADLWNMQPPPSGYIETFPDLADVPSDEQAAIKMAKYYGIVEGTQENIFEPYRGIYRFESCTMLFRLMTIPLNITAPKTVDESESFNISWNEVSDRYIYEVYESSNNLFDPAIRIYAGTNPIRNMIKTVSGTYYYRARIKYQNSAYEPDTDDGGWSKTIMVQVGSDWADLIPYNTSIDEMNLNQGDTLKGWITVGNEGDTASDPTQVYFYFNKEKIYSDQYKVDSGDIPGLNPFEHTTKVTFFNYTIPLDTAPGTYYLYYWIDATENVEENNEDNNKHDWIITINQAVPVPDLVIQGQSLNPATATVGSTFTASCSVKNQGSGMSDSRSLLKYYLSSDTQLDANDFYLHHDDSVRSLGSGESSPQVEDLVIPLEVSPGTWYVLFIADADDIIEESNENNNIGYFPIAVSAANQKPETTITFPIANQEVTENPVVEVKGTAVDPDGSIIKVEIRVNEGAWIETDNGNPWTGTISLDEGINRLEARAIDSKGLLSDNAFVDVTYTVQPVSDNSVLLIPSETTVMNGETFNLEIRLKGDNIWAAHVTCNTDPEQLTLIKDGNYGDFLDPDNRFKLPIDSDPQSGTWTGVLSLKHPAEPTSGEGIFAKNLKYRAGTGIYGSTRITGEVMLTDKNGDVLPAGIMDAVVFIDDGIHGGDGIIEGVITYPDGTPAAGVEVTISINGNEYTVTTDENGHYILEDLRDLDDGESYTITASVDGFQVEETVDSVENSVNLNLEILNSLLADLNKDGVVDIADFTLLANSYGTSEGEEGYDSRADIKKDGKINIQDLALLGSYWK